MQRIVKLPRSCNFLAISNCSSKQLSIPHSKSPMKYLQGVEDMAQEIYKVVDSKEVYCRATIVFVRDFEISEDFEPTLTLNVLACRCYVLLTFLPSVSGPIKISGHQMPRWSFLTTESHETRNETEPRTSLTRIELEDRNLPNGVHINSFYHIIGVSGMISGSPIRETFSTRNNSLFMVLFSQANPEGNSGTDFLQQLVIVLGNHQINLQTGAFCKGEYEHTILNQDQNTLFDRLKIRKRDNDGVQLLGPYESLLESHIETLQLFLGLHYL
ncbi:hypothetical protein M9H77_13966 [Catharanthus roseus]|uniref:Uncharacterized protein n=1 Tax=Catharanthus roseus TaxID=4058 RepID=A0ACC0BLY3_CATRO|nr:hypothetical protein M9H77_13966 [Catharanthus roseus]